MKNKKEVDAATQRKEQTPGLYWGTIITLVIVVLSFVIFPAFEGMHRTEKKEFTIAKYQKIPVSAAPYSLYRSNFSFMENQLRQSFNQMEPAYRSYYQSVVLRDTITEIAVNSMLQQAGIHLSDSKINQRLQETGGDWGLGISFLNERTRRFSNEKYAESVKKDRQKVQVVRSNIAVRETVGSFQNDLTFLSESSRAKKDFYQTICSPTAEGSYFEVTRDMIPETKLADFVKDHSEDFTKLDLTVIRTANKKDAETILQEVSEDGELFARRALEYNSPALIQNQGRFSGFAKKLSAQLNNTQKAVLERFNRLKKDEISEIIKIDGFYYLFKANRDAEPPQPLQWVASSKDDILQELSDNDGETLHRFIMETADEIKAQAQAASFDQAANRFHATVETASAFPINYGNCSLIPLITPDFLARQPGFLEQVFSAKPNDLLPPIEANDSVYLFQLTASETPAHLTAEGDNDNTPYALLNHYIFDESRTHMYSLPSVQD